jgi:hypothetical protein
MTWTTRLQPELTRPFGIEEVHSVWFTPKEWSGKGAVASLLIPECEMHLCMLGPDGAPVTFVNRPKANKKVKSWVRTVCELANERGAAVCFSCDTKEQAEMAASMAATLLPNHQRVALERMYQPDSRRMGGLN